MNQHCQGQEGQLEEGEVMNMSRKENGFTKTQPIRLDPTKLKKKEKKKKERTGKKQKLGL